MADMPPAEKLLSYISWPFIRGAKALLLTGICLLGFGMTPIELASFIISSPPTWLSSIWLRLGMIIVGLALIFVSITYNIWSKKRQAIDDLAEDISWAIRDLVNRHITKPIPTAADVDAFERDYKEWCEKVSKKLEMRAFFTKADQLHFDRLGFITPVNMTGVQKYDWLLSQLRLKFDRLRDVINWTQMRK